MSTTSQPASNDEMLGQRVKTLRKRHRLSQETLADMVGASASQISLIENSKTKPSLTMAIAIARALDTSLDFVTGAVDDDRRSTRVLADLHRQERRVRELETGVMHAPDERGSRYDGITKFDRVAGGGTVARKRVATGRILFPVAWMRGEGLDARRCEIISVVDESMEPTLPDGCSILINHESRGLEDGKVFVVRTGDELLVRRALKHKSEHWLLSSDNPDKKTWPTMTWPTKSRTLGEVRWVWYSLP